MKWVCGVEQSGLLNMILILHYHHSPINMIYVRQLLMLVHDGILWLGQPIPLTNMLIHKITKLTHKRTDTAKEFARKTGEKELADNMKKEYGPVKKS